MGAGMYGMNGLHPEISIKLWNTYAIPRLIYGLELFKLTKNDWNTLELCQRSILRNILHLPRTTPIVALHLLSGVLPVQAVVERSMLTLFRSLCSQKETKESDILLRQLALKNDNSNSWTALIRSLLIKYRLPTADAIYENPPSKSNWKRTVKKQVNSEWMDYLRGKATECSSLKYFSLHLCEPGKMHPVWRCTPHNKNAVLQAFVFTKFLMGQHQLQERRNKLLKSNKPCPLCSETPETIEHFLLECGSLQRPRDQQLPFITDLHKSSGGELVQTILDPDHGDLSIQAADIYRLRCAARCLVYKLHMERCAAMEVMDA